jgi:cytochrome c553
MKRWVWISGLIVLLASVVLGVSRQVSASALDQQKTVLRLGGELYDNWFASLGRQPPSGNMPVWSRQTTNTISGADTWRCTTCHGWDYQGKDGAYRAGVNYTGFPSLLNAAKMDRATILDQLNGKRDPAHDFSKLLDTASMDAMVEFITKGLIDDTQFINPVTLDVIGGDAATGKTLYNGVCAACHGKDGTALKFRFEGVDATLGTLAVLDPWRFLHKTRYGTPGTPMGKVVGVDQQWTPQQGRDVLLYAQSLPSGLTKATPGAVLVGGPSNPSVPASGPAQDWFSGLLTTNGAMVATVGFAVLLGAVLIGVLLMIVWTMRGSRK